MRILLYLLLCIGLLRRVCGASWCYSCVGDCEEASEMNCLINDAKCLKIVRTKGTSKGCFYPVMDKHLCEEVQKEQGAVCKICDWNLCNSAPSPVDSAVFVALATVSVVLFYTECS